MDFKAVAKTLRVPIARGDYAAALVMFSRLFVKFSLFLFAFTFQLPRQPGNRRQFLRVKQLKMEQRPRYGIGWRATGRAFSIGPCSARRIVHIKFDVVFFMDFTVEFYETDKGKCPVQDFLDELKTSDPNDFAAVLAGLAKLRNRHITESRSPNRLAEDFSNCATSASSTPACCGSS